MEMLSVPLEVPHLDIVVSLHTHVDPPRDEWAAFMRILRELKARAGGTDRIRNFIVSDGGAPSAAQRSEMVELFESKPSPVSLVTNTLSNPVKRGVVTVISWVNPSFRGLMPRDATHAFAHLGCERHEDAIWQTLLDLQKRLPPIRSLAHAADALGRQRPAAFHDRAAQRR